MSIVHGCGVVRQLDLAWYSKKQPKLWKSWQSGAGTATAKQITTGIDTKLENGRASLSVVALDHRFRESLAIPRFLDEAFFHRYGQRCNLQDAFCQAHEGRTSIVARGHSGCGFDSSWWMVTLWACGSWPHGWKGRSQHCNVQMTFPIFRLTRIFVNNLEKIIHCKRIVL